MPVLECSLSTFSSILDTIDSTWTTEWPAFSDTVGKINGLSFGSCYTVCGSIGYTDVSGLDALVPNLTDPNGPIVNFTTCGLVDSALIVIPLASITLSFDVTARATGLDALWPTMPSQTIDAYLSGFILITIPRDETVLEYTKPSVDISFQAIWSEWPDSNSPLFPSVPTADLLKKFTDSLRQDAREHFVQKLRRAIQAKNELLDCEWPAPANQTCTANTTMPALPCNPCDTCCKCLVQQRCDGECADCPCVNCTQSMVWRILLFSSALLMIVVSISIFLAWRR